MRREPDDGVRPIRAGGRRFFGAPRRRSLPGSGRVICEPAGPCVLNTCVLVVVGLLGVAKAVLRAADQRWALSRTYRTAAAVFFCRLP